MNNWIQNIKGQLTELATEVLHEATEEGQVSTSSELSVEKKRSTESERLYLAEKSQREALERKVQELEDQLYSTSIENDAIKERFMAMVSDRDHRIEQLNHEIESLKFHPHDKGFKNIELGDDIPKSSGAQTSQEIAKLKEKHERELSVIISVNASNIQQMREEYEQRIRDLESWNILDVKDPSAATTEAEGEGDNSALKLEKDARNAELVKLRSGLEAKEQQITELQVRLYEFQASLSRLNAIEQEKLAKEAEVSAHADEIRRLKTLNAELMSSYNEVNAQMEELKKNGGGPSGENVSVLSANISSLRSMLNETESRYEICKMEQNETASKLEMLLSDFADLKSTMQAARATAEGTEKELMTEIHSLRDTLGQEKDVREKLIADFRESMKEIDAELTLLRECNQRLVEENSELGASLAEFESLRNSLNSSNHELSAFREKFATMQSEHMEEIQELKSERDQLKHKMAEFEFVRKESMEEETKQCTTGSGLELDLNEREELARQIELLRTELREKEEELQRLRNEKLLLTSIQTDEFKRPSSDTESAVSNNDWERMAKEDIDVEGVSSSTSETKESNQHAIEGSRGKKGERKDAAIQSEESHQNTELQQKMAHLEETIRQMAEQIRILQMDLESEKEKTKYSEEFTMQIERELHSKENELANFEESITQMGHDFTTQKAQLQLEHEKQMSEIAGTMQSLELKVSSYMQTIGRLEMREADLMAENERLKTDFENLVAMSADLQAQLAVNESQNTVEAEQLNALELQLDGLRESNEALKMAYEELEQKLAQREAVENGQEKEAELLSSLKTENEELNVLVEKKHMESQNYYVKLQEFAASCEQMELQMKSAEQKAQTGEQEITFKNERIRKLENELTRLRDHLMSVEEISSKEAFAAEERETDLRRQIRQLREKYSTDESTVAQSIEHYQSEIMDLKTRMASTENEYTSLQAVLEEREASLRETSKALANMHIVLKELAEDQRSEKQQLEAELREENEELKKNSAAMLELQRKQRELEEEKVEYLSKLDALQEQLLDKNALVEELENQLEEVRTSNRGSNFSGGGSRTSHQQPSAYSYKVDDQTLRQLFLSFFTADKSKQPEIAIVMSKILGYSTDEQAQIQKSLLSSSSSWFGFGGGDGGFGGRTEVSLTEQFIRFLEQESSTARAQPMLSLPAQNERAGDFLVGESLSSPALQSSSSADLKSILDS